VKKSEELKTKRKIKFKCFLLAHILTLFFVLAPASPAGGNFSFAADLPAKETDKSFDFVQKNYYSEPFSKLIEFLNDKKKELENYGENSRSEKSFLKKNDFSNIGPANESDFTDMTADRTSSLFLLSAVLEPIKDAIIGKPKQYFGKVFCATKDFVFPGTCRDVADQKGENVLSSRKDNFGAGEIGALKRQYEDAINEANILNQKFNQLQNEISKVKAGGIIVKEPVIEQKTVERTIEKIISGLSQNDLDSGIASVRIELNNLNTNLLNKINNLSVQASDQNTAVYRAVSLTNKIDSLSGTRLSNITVSGVTGLTDADIPDTVTASNYLPLAGGTISGNLTVDGSTTLGSLTLQNATASYFTATSATASTFPYASTTAISATTASTTNLIVSNNSTLGTIISGIWNGSTMGVGYGGTGQTSFGQGWLNSDGTTISASTSPTVNYFTATSTTATSTFPLLKATTAFQLGLDYLTDITGTGLQISGNALTLNATGDWTGTLDTYEAANLLARANHTGTQGVATLSNYDLSFSSNYGTNNLISSTTMPWWAQGGLNASSTSHFVYASSTALTVSGNSYLGTVSSGTWNGSAIGDVYVNDDITLTNITQITNRAISDTSGTLTVARGGTGQTSFGQGWLNSDGTTFTSSTSPTVNYLTATSTTATSTFAGGLAVETSGLVYDYSTNNVGIGTTGPGERLEVYGNVKLSNATITNGVRALTPTGWGYLPNNYRVLMVGAASGNETVSIGYDPSGNAEASFSGDGREVLFRRGVQFVTPNAANNAFNFYNLVLLDGNVGIGTTTPYAKLSVVGETVSSYFTATSTTATSTFSTGGLTVGTNQFVVQQNSGNVGIGTTTPSGLVHIVKNAGSLILDGGGSATTFNMDWGSNNRNWMRLAFTDNTGDLNFQKSANGTMSDATSIMTIDYGGNLGIGEVAPGSKLSVSGGATIGASYDTTAAPSNGMIIEGNVGIGTAAPGAQLDVVTAGGFGQVKIESTAAGSDGAGIVLYQNSASPAIDDITGRIEFDGKRDDGNQYWMSMIESKWTNPAVAVGTSRLVFSTRGGETTNTAMTIDHSGNVGIGQTAPVTPLSLTQDTGILSWGNNDGSTQRASILGTSANTLTFSILGSEKMVITTSGNVGIGTTTPWRTLSVTGTVGFDGLTGATGAGSLCLDSNKQVVYNSASDACLSSTRATKHNIANLDLSGISLVNQLQPSSFIYNQGDGRTRYGFMAEDTALIDDRLATHNEKGEITGIDDRAIMSVMVKAIQELNLKVSDLQASAAASSGQTTDSLFSWILSKFSAMGIMFGQDKLGAKKGVFEHFEMKDASTGEDYCVKIRNGEWEKTKGTCGETSLSSSSESSSISSESSSSSSEASSSSAESSSSSSSDTSSSSSSEASSSSESSSETSSAGSSEPPSSSSSSESNVASSSSSSESSVAAESSSSSSSSETSSSTASSIDTTNNSG